MQENEPNKKRTLKEKVLRQVPKAIALTGSAVIGAALMARCHESNAHFIKVHSGILAHMRNNGTDFLFETPKHGSFVLTAVQKAQ